MKKIKNYFNSYPENSVNIMIALGKSLQEPDSFKEFVQFISSLVANEHNSKKKLTYLRMSTGVINTL